MKKNLVAVYGTLRKGQGNHRLLRDSTVKYRGTIQSEPLFTMYSQGGFPALVKGGNTSITMEVYEVDDDTLKRLDQLEGYYEGREHNHYDRIKYKTPFGSAYLYVYTEAPSTPIIKGGDWVEYMDIKLVKSA